MNKFLLYCLKVTYHFILKYLKPKAISVSRLISLLTLNNKPIGKYYSCVQHDNNGCVIIFFLFLRFSYLMLSNDEGSYIFMSTSINFQAV